MCFCMCCVSSGIARSPLFIVCGPLQGSFSACRLQLSEQLHAVPAVAVLLVLGLLMEARARRDFLQKQRAPTEQLGSVWRAALPLMGLTCELTP